MLFGIRSIRIISHLGLCHIQYSISWDCVVHVIVTQLTFLNFSVSCQFIAVIVISFVTSVKQYLTCQLLFLTHLISHVASRYIYLTVSAVTPSELAAVSHMLLYCACQKLTLGYQGEPE